MDEKLKQDDSESDQSEKSKVTSSSPTSVGGRRESSSSRTAEVIKEKKEDVKLDDTKSDDIEEINYKEMLNRYIKLTLVLMFFLGHEFLLVLKKYLHVIFFK